MAAPDRSVHILIADDHPLLREGLRELLMEQPDFQVVGVASNGSEALRLVELLKPDVLLLDLAMPNLDGISVLRRMGEATKETRVVLLTAVIDRKQVSEAFKLGARGVILKESATELLIKCIRKVMEGLYWVAGRPAANIADYTQAGMGSNRSGGLPNRYDLTARELEILIFIAAGKTNREIAHQLRISEQTVKHHLTHIFDKAGVYNRLELALFAIHHGLVSRESAAQDTAQRSGKPNAS